MDGFRFDHQRRDGNSPGGIKVTRLIVVAQDIDAALSAVEGAMGNSDATLVGQGDAVLAEARRLGVGDGEAKVI